MGYDGKSFIKEKMTKDYTPKETLKDIEKYPFVANKERNLRKETLERFGVRAGLSESDGKTVEAWYYPSYNQKGKIVGYSKQDVTKTKDEPYYWSTIGSVSISNKLFGQETMEGVKRKRVNLVVTEGQIDAISVFQSLVDSVAGTKYEGIEPLVVSIPMGTSNAVEAILHNETYVKSHESLTMFFDDDCCTPAETKKGIVKGHEAREAVASALVGNGLSLMTITPAQGFKDASDYLQAGKSDDLAKLVQFNKRVYSAESITRASDVSLEELLSPRPEGCYVNEFPKLMEKIHGFRTSELVVLTSPSNTGKSTICALFASAFEQQGNRVGLMFLEETNKETLQRMVAAKLRVNYLRFKDKPLECATREQIEKAYNEIVAANSVVMLDHFGSLPVEDLMNKIKHMHLVEGCKYIILDHLSLCISGLETDNERKAMDLIMTRLAAFCAANGVCVIAVSHINRQGTSDQLKAPKGQEDQPYWIRVSKESMRSSASLEQLAFIVLGIEPEIMPDRSRGRIRLTVLKNRPWGYLGVADTFKIDETTWDVVLMEDVIAEGF